MRAKKLMQVNRGPFPSELVLSTALVSSERMLWKTWKTRNFAGFSACRQILGIGWCVVHHGRLSLSSTAETGALIGPDPRWPGLLFFGTANARS
jgi:hypothetical protein